MKRLSLALLERCIGLDKRLYLKLMTVATADDSADSLCCHRILVASPRGVLA